MVAKEGETHHDEKPQAEKTQIDSASAEPTGFEAEDSQLPKGYFTSPYFIGTFFAIGLSLWAGTAELSEPPRNLIRYVGCRQRTLLTQSQWLLRPRSRTNQRRCRPRQSIHVDRTGIHGCLGSLVSDSGSSRRYLWTTIPDDLWQPARRYRDHYMCNCFEHFGTGRRQCFSRVCIGVPA
jgi:hypothetical protein